MIANDTQRKKKRLRNTIIVLAPLVVTVLIFTGGYLYSTHATQTERARIRVQLREDVLYDLDYLLWALEENLPTMDIIRRKNGIDLLGLGQELRENLADPEVEVYFMYFWRMLGSDFIGPSGPVYPTGSLLRVDEGMRQWFRLEYGRHDLPLSARNVALFDRTPNFVVPIGAGAYFNPVQSIATNIIEEGRIAFYRINNFTERLTPFENMQTRQFLENITDYEHLIIDLRGNTGGALWFFDEILGRFLIDEVHTAYFHNFYMDGRHNIEFMDAMGDMRPQSAPFNIDDVKGFIADEYLHIIDDITQTQYHYVYRHTVTPAYPEALFSGRVWMLVDENMMGAAQMAAAFYKDIFTLVGETTGGGLSFCNMAGVSNFITLPRTGIIIRYDAVLSLDSNGRPIEYGTEPHFFNRPGMDALETVLAFIDEDL